MQSDYHNLPLINGTPQKNGREFAAHSQQYKATAKTVSYQVDIAHAYPQEANVKSWIRNYTLHRKKDFTITDKWKLSACNEPSVLNLMTCCEVEIDRNKNITLTGEAGRFKVEYDKKTLIARNGYRRTDRSEINPLLEPEKADAHPFHNCVATNFR